jgi:hypothetical protein
MTLEQWLTIASKGLSPESAAQVRAEIEQHCAVGVVDVAALGDPKAANREYRKVLLTTDEAYTLGRLQEDPQTTVLVWICMIIMLPGMYLNLTNPILLIGSVPALTISVEMLMPRCHPSRARFVRHLKWTLLGVSFILAWGSVHWYLTLGFLPVVMLEYAKLQLRRKLPMEQWPVRLSI